MDRKPHATDTKLATTVKEKQRIDNDARDFYLLTLGNHGTMTKKNCYVKALMEV